MALPAVFFVPRPAVPFRGVALVGLLMCVEQFGLLYLALHLGMPAGLASLVLASQVLMTVLIAAFRLDERPTSAQVVGIAVGAAGLIVVAIGRSSATPVIGIVLCLGAALSWASGNVAARRLGISSGLSLVVWSATVVPAPLLGLSLLVDGPDEVGRALTHLPAGAVASTVYTAVMASLVGYGIWNSLLARHNATSVVPFVLLVPPVGLLSAWLVQGETPNGPELAGGLLLLAGVGVTVLRRSPSAGAPGSVRRSRARRVGRSCSGSAVPDRTRALWQQRFPSPTAAARRVQVS